MECPRRTATSGSLIPCKFCHKKSFNSQSRLCEHEVEEHGYVRPCTVTTPRVTPSIKTSGKRNMEDLQPLNLSDPKSAAKLWAKWTQENEKLFREYVLNMKSSQSIDLPTSISNSSYCLDFVPDYASAEFPTSLNFLMAATPVAVETNPISGLTLMPASVEFQTVPAICASDSATLEIVQEDDLGSLEVNDIVYDPVLCVTDSLLITDEENAFSNLNPGASTKEELILIPAAADPEIVEGAVIEAVDISAPSQGILDSSEVLGEDPSVAIEIQSGQVLLDDYVLDETTGQLMLPNNAVLDPSSEALSQDTQPVAFIQTLTDQPILDETTGKFIFNCEPAIQALPTIVMNQDGNIITVPAAAVAVGNPDQPAGGYGVSETTTQTCTADVANEGLLIENRDLLSSVSSGSQDVEVISEQQVNVVNSRSEGLRVRDSHIDVGSVKSKLGAVTESDQDKIQMEPDVFIPTSLKLLQPQTSKTNSRKLSSVFLSSEGTKSSPRNIFPKFLRSSKTAKSPLRKPEPSCGEKLKKGQPSETLATPKSVVEVAKRKMARDSKSLNGNAIESMLKAISSRGRKFSATDINGNSSSLKVKNVVSRERAETSSRTLQSSRLATITTRSRSNKLL